MGLTDGRRGGHFFQKLGAVESVEDSVFCMRGAFSVRMGRGTAPGKTSEIRIDYLSCTVRS